PLPPGKPPPARHRPGARSARRQGRRHSIADHFREGDDHVFRTLFDSLRFRPSGISARGTPRRPRASRLFLETLEDRTTPSTFTVTNLLDSGPGSLRA